MFFFLISDDMTFNDYELDEDFFFEPELSFKDYLARGKYVKALDVAERNRLEIKPNKYISSLEDLAIKAAFEYQSDGDYQQAFSTMYTYAPKNPLTKDFANHFAMELFSNLVDAYNNSEQDNAYSNIKELTHGLFWLDKNQFPEGLSFEKKGPVSISSIVDSLRVSKVLENYFVEVANYFDKMDFVVKIEMYEAIDEINKEFDVIDNKIYSGLKFSGVNKK